jgi:signal transduction histidine kinase
MATGLPDAALAAHPTEVAVIDAEGTIVYTNEAWATFGAENDITGDPSTLGADYLAVCRESDDSYARSAEAGIRAILDGDRDEFEFEYPCHSPDTERWFTMRARPFEYEGERYVLLMHLDITARRLAEERVERKNERLQRVAGILSHDLRNPLNVALGRLASLDADPDETARIRDALERMQDIVADALVLAQGTVDERVLIDLDGAARDAWASIQAPDATLAVDADVTVDADPSLLAHLFENLFRNAVQHGGPDVRVSVEALPDGFAVTDDGPGIPEDELATVFDTGFTTAEDGTGLGLAIVDLVAEAHGWSVDAVPTDGGARFEVGDVDFVDADPERVAERNGDANSADCPS